MAYSLTGEFLESCDCTVICPCWVDDDPVGGHCTGFILWSIDNGFVGGEDVADCKVVSVSTHSGNRRRSGATTSVIYVDPAGHDADQVVKVLGDAFAGKSAGILRELSEVSGTVVGVYPAAITLETEDRAGNQQPWRVLVKERIKQSRVFRIEATGYPRVFDKEEVEARQKGEQAQPMQLEHTALSHELQAKGPVEAQQGERLTVRVGALPGGSLEVQGRSGMRGTFAYEYADSNPHADPTAGAR